MHHWAFHLPSTCPWGLSCSFISQNPDLVRPASFLHQHPQVWALYVYVPPTSPVASSGNDLAASLGVHLWAVSLAQHLPGSVGQWPLLLSLGNVCFSTHPHLRVTWEVGGVYFSSKMRTLRPQVVNLAQPTFRCRKARNPIQAF